MKGHHLRLPGLKVFRLHHLKTESMSTQMHPPLALRFRFGRLVGSLAKVQNGLMDQTHLVHIITLLFRREFHLIPELEDRKIILVI
jgi:hypothetical protein